MSDLQARVSQLWIYPVKSCGGVSVLSANLTETGLEWDRAWMVVDAQGDFVSQREAPRMALIEPKMRHLEMVLRAPGMLALHVSLHEAEEPVQVTVWGETVKAAGAGASSKVMRGSACTRCANKRSSSGTSTIQVKPSALGAGKCTKPPSSPQTRMSMTGVAWAASGQAPKPCNIWREAAFRE